MCKCIRCGPMIRYEELGQLSCFYDYFKELNSLLFLLLCAILCIYFLQLEYINILIDNKISEAFIFPKQFKSVTFRSFSIMQVVFQCLFCQACHDVICIFSISVYSRKMKTIGLWRYYNHNNMLKKLSCSAILKDIEIYERLQALWYFLIFAI
jgi:hypothetical protein